MQAGFGFPGHTDFLAKLTGAPRAVMMLVGDQLRVIPLTVHIPLAQVPRAVDDSSIIETAEIALAALKRDFAIAGPRLAIAASIRMPARTGFWAARKPTSSRPPLPS